MTRPPRDAWSTFIPFDDEDKTPRFFARPVAFDAACPQCGRLLLVGPRRRDDALYNRATGILYCRRNARHWREGHQGCGRRWLVGLVFWGLNTDPRGKTGGRPFDQRPSVRQLAELREAAQGIWPQLQKRKGDAVNKVEPDRILPYDPDD